MTKLQPLKSRLSALRQRRWALRTSTALMGAIVGALWILAGLGVFDWLTEPDRVLRVLLIASSLAMFIWIWRKFTAPLLGHSESELEMALLVERQQRIDSDLVAALQFESANAAGWGSRQLQTAVIDYVAEFGREIDVYQGLSAGQFTRRSAWLCGTVAVIGIIAFAFPAHFHVFWKRLALGADHYPTRTMIERIAVNKKMVFPDEHESKPIKAAAWEPLVFEVHCSGELPAAGHAEIKAVTGNTRTQIALKPLPDRPGVFSGQLERLVDSIQYQLYLGDAWTDATHVEVIPLPVVDVSLVVTPPAYAAKAEQAAEAPAGARQVSVVEGSRVAVRLVSDKRLDSATLSVLEAQYPLKRASLAAAEVRDTWTLDQDNTPLARVMEPLRYEVQVVDSDGLSLRAPIQGFIRIKADRPPRVTVAMITQHVLPTGRPTISYGAADDYGIAHLRVRRQVSRLDGRMSEDTLDVPVAGPPEKLLRGKYPLELSSLKLVKGDQLRVTFEAVDYRGALPGKSALSEPLVLQITDERGVLAAMVEADERSARQLDAIIQRQLGIGDSP